MVLVYEQAGGNTRCICLRQECIQASVTLLSPSKYWTTATLESKDTILTAIKDATSTSKTFSGGMVNAMLLLILLSMIGEVVSMGKRNIKADIMQRYRVDDIVEQFD